MKDEFELLLMIIFQNINIIPVSDYEAYKEDAEMISLVI